MEIRIDENPPLSYQIPANCVWRNIESLFDIQFDNRDSIDRATESIVTAVLQCPAIDHQGNDHQGHEPKAEEQDVFFLVQQS